MRKAELERQQQLERDARKRDVERLEEEAQTAESSPNVLTRLRARVKMQKHLAPFPTKRPRHKRNHKRWEFVPY